MDIVEQPDGRQGGAAGADGPAVELVYQNTVADFAGALRARAARTGAARRKKWLFSFIGTLSLIGGAALLAGNEPDVGRAVAFLVGGVLLWVIGPLGPRLQARALRGLLEKTGETRAVVDGTGVRLTATACDTRIGWSAQPTYAETDELFVMLSEDKRAVAMTVLPKRGARSPADIDRLRAILDANLRRL
ncbi:YcxB family protein [Streptomyces sp. A1547]|uniref:YcxB family protein n=1 Tax=Streptomyces sp. R33 TaxID=3238629 RepID=A0AB39Y9E1_9ACTN|nr:YcxB family protein [Streptomyces sp. A1547]THA38197.1 YcxB family protein [Streptomyces sp. A1547]